MDEKRPIVASTSFMCQGFESNLVLKLNAPAVPVHIDVNDEGDHRIYCPRSHKPQDCSICPYKNP